MRSCGRCGNRGWYVHAFYRVTKKGVPPAKSLVIELFIAVESEIGRSGLDCPASQSHAWLAMQVQTKFLRLFREVAIGDQIDGWRDCWDWRVGQMPGAARGDGREANAISPDAIGPVASQAQD